MTQAVRDELDRVRSQISTLLFNRHGDPMGCEDILRYRELCRLEGQLLQRSEDPAE